MTSQTPDVCGIHNTKEVMPESKRQFVPNKVEYLIKTVLDAYLHKVECYVISRLMLIVNRRLNMSSISWL